MSRDAKQTSEEMRGKHKLVADLKRVHQETHFLEEELEQLEKMDNASAACNELFGSIEAKPDPLLPETNGPVNPMWDSWFEGPRDSKRCRCWIF